MNENKYIGWILFTVIGLALILWVMLSQSNIEEETAEVEDEWCEVETSPSGNGVAFAGDPGESRFSVIMTTNGVKVFEPCK